MYPSMKVEWVQGAPLHSHTQLHTQGLGRLCSIGQGLPSTIVFSLGLSLPYAVVWAAKYPRGAKGCTTNQNLCRIYCKY